MVFERVKAIIVNQFDVEEDSVTMETNIAEDLVDDSLDLVEFAVDLEDEFKGMKISDDELKEVVTVGDMVRFIEEHL